MSLSARGRWPGSGRSGQPVPARRCAKPAGQGSHSRSAPSCPSSRRWTRPVARSPDPPARPSSQTCAPNSGRADQALPTDACPRMERHGRRALVPWRIEHLTACRPVSNAPQTATWCPGRASNPYALFRAAADFKSAVSTDFTTRAACERRRRSASRARQTRSQTKRPRNSCEAHTSWRRDPESNRAERICNPVHNRFAIAPSGSF